MGQQSPASHTTTTTSVTSAAAIRTAITSGTNAGTKAAAAFSSRIASRAHKGKGKFAAKAAAKVDDLVFNFLDYLDEASKEALVATASVDKLYLARVTKVLGGSQMEILTQDNITERARIPGTMRAKGHVSHKRHMTHVFGVGDVVIVQHGDIRAKMDSPALLVLLEERYKKLGYPVPKGFFSSAKSAAELEEELKVKDPEEEVGWEFDYSEETTKMRKKRTLRVRKGPAGGAGEESEDEAEEAPVDIDAI